MSTDWPSGRQMQGPYSGVISTEVTADTTREGHVDNGLIAYEERVAVCSKYWPRARRQDFEQANRRGTRWLDKATGTVYRREPGCSPLMAPTLEAVDCWLIEGGELVLLIRADRPPTGSSTVVHGEVRGGRVDAHGQIVWEKR